MAMTDPGAIEDRLRALYRLVDAKDFRTLAASMAADVQGVDELSGGWLRGREALGGYFESLGDTVQDVHSELSDIHIVEVGEAALVTLIIDQTYVLDGAAQHVRAPTSILFVRDGTEWQIALFHSVPLAEEPPGDYSS